MRRASAGFLLAFLLAGGCRREAPAPPAPAVAAQTATSGGRITERLESEVRTLNYLLQTTDDERRVLSYLYDPLIDLDQNLAPIPGLATSWEIADGGHAYVLHLDPRATFSDGSPLLASDVVFTLHKIATEDAAQFAAAFEGLDTTETRAVDDHTVRVVFKTPRAAQLLAFNIGVLPEHVYGKGDFAKQTRVVSAGPYQLERWDRGRGILIRRRADYWREKPRIESILFRAIADDAVAWRALMRGDIDLGPVPNDVWWREKDNPEVRARLDFQSVYILQYNAIVWNLTNPLFTDKRVRLALAMSFDRHHVIDELYHGQARAVTGPFTPDQWANDPEVNPVEYNPKGAAALLASAGWVDSNGDGVLDRRGRDFRFKLLVPAGTATARDQAQVLQQSLSALGVAVEITPRDAAAFFDSVMNRDFESAFIAWINDPDPDPYAYFHSSQLPPNGLNIVGYSNAEADQLMDEGRTELDRTRRAEIYHRLHELLATDQPYLWTVQVASKWAVNRRLHDVRVASGLGLFFWYPGPRTWWAAPKT